MKTLNINFQFTTPDDYDKKNINDLMAFIIDFFWDEVHCQNLTLVDYSWNEEEEE